ncbi:MAG: hypothetical protein F6K39_34665, partial [Okeania sp. SIO3B3]|nr:hypothetical protein [Okeania sp. SIO3B3]
MTGFAIVLLLVFATLIYFFTVRVREGHKPALRHIEAFEAIKGSMGQSIESGQALHISLGIGGIADQTTADSLAGLSVLRYVGNQAATTGVSPTVSMADPMVLLMAQQAMQSAFGNDRAGAADTYQNIYWTAPQPAAYAAGVLNILNVDEVKTNVMFGHFGDEYLLMGETAVRNNTMHIGGASDPNV